MHIHHPDWSSHIPVLIRAMEITDGPVLELGLGISSTPLLHMLCLDRGRVLVSYDNDKQYTDMFRKYHSQGHAIKLVSNWDELDTKEHQWSVVLIDHKPEDSRKVEVRRLAWVDYIIIHDTEPANNYLYEYDQIYPLFKYRFDYTKARAHTTVLSNSKDLKEFHEK